MKKIVLDKDTYFIGENGIYLEMQNTRELIDQDGIKRIVVELKDQKKIDRILNFDDSKITNNTNTTIEIDIPDIL